MKLASLKHGRDGKLIIVNSEISKAIYADDITPTMQSAFDEWAKFEPLLSQRSQEFADGKLDGFELNQADLASPLPRAYQWADGSAYVNHVELVRKARGAEMPETFWTDPLMYQGGSDSFLGPQDDIVMETEEWGIDFEAEIAVITDDVPMGVSPEDAKKHIKLIMIMNDVSLRNLIPGELGKGFGFFQSKPSSAFSPVAVTPNELGEAWDGGKLHLPMHVHLNGEKFGSPNAGVDMIFDFPRLISHAAKSRPLGAGSIIGSGTISNKDASNGFCCLAETRMIETIANGKPITEFMKFGDKVRIEMFDKQGNSIFGTIEQEVKKYQINKQEMAA